ncbi:MAG: putative undecaprenyl-phosphate N-acetylglucosaminyl 1-phosphate transferase [Dehalococcoidia bacterium]|nr:putative undecaprenyl-phosphate N-acetylglucosaminyl 1-phosphate transferase [Bacillota bacterium]
MSDFLIFIISFLFSLLLIFLLGKIGIKYRLYDESGKDTLKIHKKPTTYLGGLAIFLVFSILVLIFSYLKEFLDWKIGGIILAGFLVFLLGFWDDYKWKKFGVKSIFKFLFLLSFSFFAAVIILNNGVKIQFFPLIIIEGILTFIYIFILINAVNYQDGIDGLAGGLVAISLTGFIISSVIFGNNLTLVISLILMGAVLGFLVFNFPPAKIFMGDSGAYFLGFILAVLAMIFSKPYNISSILGPIFIIGLPLFDGVFINVRRLFQKKSIFLGDRKHFYDRLLFQKGFSLKKTLLISYLIQVIFIGIGLFISVII